MIPALDGLKKRATLQAAASSSAQGAPPASLPLLETKLLSKWFGGLHVTREVSLSLRPGARTGLIGPNGAGKTTLINLMTGVLAPSEGHVLLRGEDVTRLSQPQRVRRGLARTFQITQLAPRLPVCRQVELAIHQRLGSVNKLLRPLDSFAQVREEARAILEALRLDALADSLPVELAYGEQRLVEIALALALRPQVLLLDEPMAGVPSAERRVILEALGSLPPSLAILMIEHDMGLVFSFATRIIVLADGAVLADGTPQEIRDHPAVRSVYLGGTG
jgi:branched-chain amino acid transport system ATP-binding protein